MKNLFKSARFMLTATATWMALLATNASAVNSTILAPASDKFAIDVTLRSTAGGAITDDGGHNHTFGTLGVDHTLRANFRVGSVRARTQLLDASGNPIANCIANDTNPDGIQVTVNCDPGPIPAKVQMFLD